MDEKKKHITKKDAPKKIENSSSSKKPLTSSKGEKGDAPKGAEFDIFISELDGILDDLFVDIEDGSNFEAKRRETAPASPDKKAIKAKIKDADTIETNKSVNFDAKLQETHPHIIDQGTKDNLEKAYAYDGADEDDKVVIKDSYQNLEKNIEENIRPVETEKSSINQIDIIKDDKVVDPEKSKRKPYLNKFVVGGILIITAIVISLVIFRSPARFSRTKDVKTVIAPKIKQPLTTTPTKQIIPPSNKIINLETEPVVQSNTAPSKTIREIKKTVPRIGEETSVFKAPALSYPYFIFAGSYRSMRSAELSAEAYRKIGLQAFWVRVELLKKGVWYRVFIGCYKDSGAAEKIIKTKQLKDAGPRRIGYANFIGTYVSEDILKKQSRFLSKSGYSPYVIEDDNGKRHLYVGAFYTLKGAEKLSAELSTKGIRSQIVKR